MAGKSELEKRVGILEKQVEALCVVVENLTTIADTAKNLRKPVHCYLGDTECAGHNGGDVNKCFSPQPCPAKKKDWRANG